MKRNSRFRAVFTASAFLILLAGCTASGDNVGGPASVAPGAQTQGAPQAQSGTPASGPGESNRQWGGVGASGGAAAQPQGGAARQGGQNGGQAGNRRSAVVTVEVQAARTGALTVENTAAGAVMPETQSSVAAGASGSVKALLKQAGDWVDSGTPVIQLDDAALKLSVRLAKATLENAKINAGTSTAGGATGATSKLGLQLQSAQSSVSSAEKNWASAQALQKIGGISGSDYDNAQVQLQTSQANLESAKMAVQQNILLVETASIQLEQAQLNLANALIKAPYAGQISVINVHPGEFVGQSTPVFGLVSRSKVISFSVSPSDAPGLPAGTLLKFTINGATANTQVAQTPGAPLNGLVALTAALPASVKASLGTVGTISYRVVLANGTIVPLTALQSAENKTFVYTNENNKAARYEVQVLDASGTEVAISGLNPKASVILNPPPGLLVGATIQAVASAGVGSRVGGNGSVPAVTPAGGQRQWNQAGAGGAPGAGNGGAVGGDAAASGKRQWGKGSGGASGAGAQPPVEPNSATSKGGQ